MYLKKDFLLYSVSFLFYFFPISFVLGSLIVNLNTMLFITFSFIYISLNKLKLNFNLTNSCLLLFFLTVIFSSYINLELIGNNNFYKSIFLIRFYFLFILLEVLLLHKKIDLKYFFYICFILIIFVCLDLSLQFFSGKNILGYEPWEGRITGIFESEAIAGSYVQKIFLFSLIAIFIQLSISSRKKDILYIFFFITIFFSSYIASNRISFLILFSLFFFLIIFFKEFRKNLIITLIISIPFFNYLYKNNDQLNLKYKGFINKISKIVEFSRYNNRIDANKNYEIDNDQINVSNSNLPNHLKIYITSYKSFKENYFLGSGLKSFRYNCYKFLDKKNTLCSTHPHNYHLEILHDSGLIGFLFLLIFTFSLLIKKTKLIFTNSLSYENKIILSLLIINFMIEIFPFKSTGSLFTTWNGSLLWLSVALLNFNEKAKI